MKPNRQDFKNADLLCFEMFKESVLTEKSVKNEMQNNCMTFLIRKDLTKTHVKIAIETLFKTKVKSIRVINTKSRQKQFKRNKFMTPTFKKIMVAVENIDAVREVLNG